MKILIFLLTLFPALSLGATQISVGTGFIHQNYNEPKLDQEPKYATILDGIDEGDPPFPGKAAQVPPTGTFSTLGAALEIGYSKYTVLGTHSPYPKDMQAEDAFLLTHSDHPIAKFVGESIPPILEVSTILLIGWFFLLNLLRRIR